MADKRVQRHEPLELALSALARKERTVAEMGSWLRTRGVEPEQADDVIDRLVSTGVLDDARYARRYAEDKRALKHWGSERIRSALLDRGISLEDAETAVAELDPEQEIELAGELLSGRGTNLDDPAERRRALGLLVRRGYDSEVAYEAIRRVRRAA
jgi:regulatory protein